MLATIDAGGRIVVPKEVRERLGLRPGSRIELIEVEGHLEISPAITPVRLVDHEGALVAVADTDLPALTAAQVRDAVEATRR
ncbi:MAG: AbrB/MazE/SpoVT family DNA-binding domain-containing protein [Mycobacterium sp.]